MTSPAQPAPVGSNSPAAFVTIESNQAIIDARASTVQSFAQSTLMMQQAQSSATAPRSLPARAIERERISSQEIRELVLAIDQLMENEFLDLADVGGDITSAFKAYDMQEISLHKIDGLF